MLKNVLRYAHEGEEGHAGPFWVAFIAGAGIVLVGIGAASDTGWLAIVGGIVGGLGVFAYDAIRHSTLDKEFFRRTDDLVEKK